MPRTVLIVDDHASFRRAARRLLQSDGFEVIGEAADGGSAIAETARLRPDVVLLDVQLPDIDGFGVARRLAETEPHSTVILISSRDAREYGDALAACPSSGYIAKGELSGAAIRELLG